MEHLLESFLDKLSSEDTTLMETIKNGFHCIFEGYADVRDIEAPDALTQFNRMAANTAMNMGNPILSFLQNSAMSRANLFSYDDEPELDDFDTSDFNPMVNTQAKAKDDDLASKLGKGASELSDGDSDDWAFQSWGGDDWSDLSD